MCILAQFAVAAGTLCSSRRRPDSFSLAVKRPPTVVLVSDRTAHAAARAAAESVDGDYRRMPLGLLGPAEAPSAPPIRE
jgi:hypothetical protein